MDQDQERRVAQLPLGGWLRRFFPPASRRPWRWKVTSPGRKNTTARGRSRKSSFSFCANTVWNTMSVISGLDLACDPFRVVMRSRVGPHFPGALPPATLSAPFQDAQRLRPEMEGTCLLTLSRNPGRAISALALQGETKGRPKGRPCIFHGGQRSQFVPVNVRSFETF
jgi:hypothetical protein